MKSKVTSGIRVGVETNYKGLFMGSEGAIHVFSYQITISNEGSEAVQLLSRAWNIVDSKDSPEQVKGEGVIGEKPVIEPGAYYSYESFCHLSSTIGAMSGNYTMKNLDTEETFDVEIPVFQLFAPYKRN